MIIVLILIILAGAAARSLTRANRTLKQIQLAPKAEQKETNHAD